MMGHRGVRLGITYPEVTECQVRAILEDWDNARRLFVKVMPKDYRKSLLDQKGTRKATQIVAAE